MEYFLYLSGDTNADFINSTYRLGEQSFNVFWSDDGLKVLLNMIQKYPDKAQELKIVDSHGKNHSIEEFIGIIEKLQVRMN